MKMHRLFIASFFSQALDKDGICSPGEKVDDRQVLVNKAMPVVSSTTPGTLIVGYCLALHRQMAMLVAIATC